MGVFARSMEITKLCFSVIKSDKALLLFPVLSGLFSLLFIAALIVPTFIVAFMAEGGGALFSGVVDYIVIFLIYFGLAFIATFFNVCTVFVTKRNFEGNPASVGEAFGFAFGKLHLIALWSIVSATVGLIFRIIEDIAQRAGPIGKILLLLTNAILGMAWAIVTIFVVPSLVYDGVGPFAAIKRSVETLKKTWGESLVRHFGMGLVQMLLVVVGIIGSFVLFIGLGAVAGVWGVLAALFLMIMYFLVVIVFFSVANTIFNTALFVYAETGQVPNGFNADVMQNAFKGKNAPVRSAQPDAGNVPMPPQ